MAKEKSYDQGDWWSSSLPSFTIHEGDDAPVDTGLLNAEGKKIFRRPQRQKLGFDLTGATAKRGN
jgi:hypothetical protein